MFSKIPLAWLQLVRNKSRFFVTVVGIAFIVLLMFIQIGFQNALYSSATQLHRHLQGDLFLVSSQYKSLTANQSFPRTRLYQVLGFNGVESVSSMYLGFAKFKNPVNGEKYSIYLIGIEPGRVALNLPELSENVDKIKIPDVVLYDQSSRKEFGPIAERFEQHSTNQTVEIFPFNSVKGYKVRVGGLFSLGPSFGVDGNLIVSDLTFIRIFLNMRSPKMIDIGAVTLKPNADIQKVVENIQAYFQNDIRVFTYKEFNEFEKKYWATRTPIGFIFDLMLIMVFVIGIVIVYQILYTNISNQIIAYATLKAIGYQDSYLLKVVFQQAIILAVLGYVPGLFLCLGIYNIAIKATKLPIKMDLNNMLFVLFSTILMCMTSGLLATNKLRSADPAEIFS
ncbi:MAG: ABC transporter permease DevC [Brasilonema angustatum HA4187-MV1]|jgi:putative ABC transport system permease protein|nr:ABC transporter permease DevC [Brasilonema angustatum HA4187-MV1]